MVLLDCGRASGRDETYIGCTTANKTVFNLNRVYKKNEKKREGASAPVQIQEV